MSTYEPGTVALARATNPVTERRCGAMFRVTRYAHGWAVLSDPDDFFNDEEQAGFIEIVRPLVVLDLEDLAGQLAADVRFAASVLDDGRSGMEDEAERLRDLAGQIEAQTTPPRIPEPVRTGALVREGDGGPLWARTDEDTWVSLDDGTAGVCKPWAFIEDPVLVRDGIEDGAS